VKDEQFIQLVRRSRPSALIPLVAELASDRMEPATWTRPGQVGFGTPWALAEISRVSLAYGNEHRQDATTRHVAECNDAYNELEDPELVEGYQGPLAGFFLRIAEQLEYNLPLLSEMSRAMALFGHTQAARTHQVLHPGWEEELFGCDLTSFIAAGHMLHFAVAPNKGRFNPAWLDQKNLAFVADYINPALLRTAWESNYVITPAEFAAQNGRPSASAWRRFAYNPLMGRPVVSGLGTDWLIPVPGLVVRRLSPLGIYYAGVARWGKPFADDVGDLFEQYIGNTLRLLGAGTVEPGFSYDADNKATVDFIVLLPEVVVLVEVKSVRPTAKVRAGTPEAGDELKRMLGKGLRQLDRADTLIRDGHPAFAHVPTDRPRVGMLVTMEDFHVANSGFHRPMLDLEDQRLPSTIASAGEIEHWVTVEDMTPGQVVLAALARFGRGEDLGAGFALRQELVGRHHRRNEIIDDAWKSGPWQQLSRD
jgi:hypothetical protein